MEYREEFGFIMPVIKRSRRVTEMSEEEVNAICDEYKNRPKINLRKLADDMESNKVSLCWDMSISQDEFIWSTVSLYHEYGHYFQRFEDRDIYNISPIQRNIAYLWLR